MNETKTSVRIESNRGGTYVELFGDGHEILELLLNAIIGILDRVEIPTARHYSISIQNSLKEYLQERQEQEGETQ